MCSITPLLFSRITAPLSHFFCHFRWSHKPICGYSCFKPFLGLTTLSAPITCTGKTIMQRLAIDFELPYLHNSSTHLFSLKVALKFACVLQSDAKLKLSFNVTWFTSRSWISMFMKHKGFSQQQMCASNKMFSAGTWCHVFYICMVESASNYFFEFSIAILPERYNRENTVSRVAKKSSVTDWQQNPFHVLYHVVLGCFELCEYCCWP